MSEPSGVVIEEYHNANAEEGCHAVPVEASDPAQDWVGQEMIKPHVIMLREKMKFTDSQIKNGMQYLRDRDGREPTQAEFDMQWNEIRGTGIEYLIDQSNLKDEEIANKEVEIANKEVEIANKEAEISERDHQITDLTRMKDRLLERTRILDNEVDIQQMQALQERNRADKSHQEKLKALQEKEAERIKNEKLEKEKEAERIKNEKLEKEKEAERIKNEKLEKEKEAERIKSEKLAEENSKLLQQMEELQRRIGRG